MEKTINYPEKLNSIIAEIEKHEHIDSDYLVRFLQSATIKQEDFLAFSDFDHHVHFSYGRTKIFTGCNFVIFLMSWGKNDFTAIHNHGQCDWGAVYFLGEVNHRGYQLDNNQIVLTGKSVVPTGTVVPVKGELIHAMGNLTDKPSLSLHIYGLNHSIDTMDTTTRIFELEKKRVRFTSGEAFIDGYESFGKPLHNLKTNEETLLDYLEILLPFYQKNHKSHMVKKIKTIIQHPELYLSE